MEKVKTFSMDFHFYKDKNFWYINPYALKYYEIFSMVSNIKIKNVTLKQKLIKYRNRYILQGPQMIFLPNDKNFSLKQLRWETSLDIQLTYVYRGLEVWITLTITSAINVYILY